MRALNIAACMIHDRNPKQPTQQTWEEAEALIEAAERGEIRARDAEMRRFLKTIHEQALRRGTPEDEDWNIVVESVCEAMRQEPQRVLGRCRQHGVTAAKNLIAGIWAESHSLPNTAKRLRWRSHVQVYHARRQVSKMLANPVQAVAIREALRLIKQRAPHILAREVILEPKNSELFS